MQHFPEQNLLYDFLQILQDEYAGDSTELMTIVESVMNLMQGKIEPQLIVENMTSGNRFLRVKGLSIYLPLQGYSQFYANTDFANWRK